jgi:UDP-glucose 4-epimerase
VLHSTFDAYLLDIPYRRMLAICFCCDCCCTVRHSLDVDAAGFRDTVIRLPGLTIEVEQACTGCGACLAVCPVQAISLHPASQDKNARSLDITRHNAQARIDLERCKGCGRCISTCPAGALHLQLSDCANTQARLLDRVAKRTDIGVTSRTEPQTI